MDTTVYNPQAIGPTQAALAMESRLAKLRAGQGHRFARGDATIDCAIWLSRHTPTVEIEDCLQALGAAFSGYHFTADYCHPLYTVTARRQE